MVFLILVETPISNLENGLFQIVDIIIRSIEENLLRLEILLGARHSLNALQIIKSQTKRIVLILMDSWIDNENHLQDLCFVFFDDLFVLVFLDVIFDFENCFEDAFLNFDAVSALKGLHLLFDVLAF